ncbi:O-antigen ligase family protein [Paenibacillus sp. N3.4]|uniref:O-antigen ligase family protein n=1 Tax=Paenibacillus sp. N3.4 TaxID=2603222 RepID=UPI0011C823F4|nr:O-antigen ligase family protein [Paenibacillus sp. N3.4]TXK77947.1 hypothetical protein FU659_21395 [Paenibacillus sp. N3.4]
MVYVSEKSNSINYLAAFSICLMPILGPYKLIGPFSIGIIFLVLVAVLSIIIKKTLSINLPLFFILIVHCFLSFLSYFSLDYNEGILSMFWSILMALTSSLALMQIVPFYEKKSFLRVLTFLSIVCGSFMVYQFIVINQGGIPYNGKLFGELAKGYTWSDSVTYLRMNSFFSEPSYFAIFFLPLMAFMFINEKKTYAIICCLLLFLSTSTLGILGSIIVILMYALIKKNYKIIVVLLILGIIIVFCVQILNIEWLLRNNLNKIATTNENSQIRFIGYLEYFWELPIVNQFLGVGFSQLSNYFSNYGLYNYSNTFVIVLINYGILGLIAFIFFIIWLFKVTTDDGKIFLGIMVIISAIDSFIYSNNFYYVVFYILVFSKSSVIQNTKRTFSLNVSEIKM